MSKCDICLNESKNCSNSISVNRKLEFCVPEKNWRKGSEVCDRCISELNTAYAFRKRCLYSEKEILDIRKTKKSKLISLNRFFPKLNVYVCSKCPQIFKYSSQLYRHNFSHHNSKKPFNCLFCNIEFRTSLDKAFHEYRHLIKYRFNFISLSSLWHNFCFKRQCRVRNLRQVETCIVGDFVCNQEELIEDSLDDLNEPLDLKDSTKSIFNDESVQVKTELDRIKTEVEVAKIEVIEIKKKRGRKKTIGTESLECHICNSVFSSKYLVRRHVNNVHCERKRFKCDECSRRFTSVVYLNAHKRYHSRDRPYTCSKCGKGFITASDLYHHEKIHENKRAYKCETCAKAFNTSSALHKHKICVHLDRNQWKHVCAVCDKRFPLKINLKTHVKVHTGERNYACHLCDKRCISRSTLTKHIDSHSNIRNFRCSICELDYKYERTLKIHLKKVHGMGDTKVPLREKRFFCDMCPKSYFANNQLQIHLRTHTGEKPFACELCQKCFGDGSYIKQHLKITHNIYT